MGSDHLIDVDEENRGRNSHIMVSEPSVNLIKDQKNPHNLTEPNGVQDSLVRRMS